MFSSETNTAPGGKLIPDPKARLRGQFHEVKGVSPFERSDTRVTHVQAMVVQQAASQDSIERHLTRTFQPRLNVRYKSEAPLAHPPPG
jgi:hypothetical protein